MIKIIIEALKLAPRFLWQLYIQPSKIYDFYHAERKNLFVLTWGFFFSGMMMGSLLAIPYYFFFHDLILSILFVFLLAFVFTVALSLAVSFSLVGAFAIAFLITSALAFAVSSENDGAFSIAIAALLIVAFAGAGAIASTISFAIPGDNSVTIASTITGSIIGAIAGAVTIAGVFFILGIVITKDLSISNILEWGILKKSIITAFFLPTITVLLILLFILCIIFFHLIFKGKYKASEKYAPVIFACALIYFVLMIAPLQMEWTISYGITLYHISFLMGYLFHLLFLNWKKPIFSKNNIGSTKKNIEFLLKYKKIQISNLSWGPVTWIIVYSTSYWSEKKIPDSPLDVTTFGFLFISLFISHIPDYLICLPIWARQRSIILGNSENRQEVTISFENSIVFKHEQLFFQLPGLYKIMLHFAYNTEFGLNETVKYIIRLHKDTFQQKQAEKALLELAKNRVMAHHLFLLILEMESLPIIDAVAPNNQLASLYLALTDIENHKKLTASMRNLFFISSAVKKSEANNLSWFQRKDIFRYTEEERELVPKPLEERIEIVCKLMSVEKGYRCNEEMIKTLEACRQLLIAENLQDIIRAFGTLQDIKKIPKEIKYFSYFSGMMPRIKILKDTCQQIDAIERIDTRRMVLHDLRGNMAFIIGKTDHDLFEPFKHIWTEGFTHCQEIIERETLIMQGSALPAIRLKNHEITATEEGCKLYFEITNKGQELASHVTISIQPVSPDIVFPAGLDREIDVIESDAVKEISFPIKADRPSETLIKGTIRFTDRVGSDKQLSFSFPVSVRQTKVEFIKIKNPYMIGQPLKGETPLFYGREDVHDFIDENILASGDHHTFVCHGLRRSGKTSLLYRIETLGFTDKRLSPVYVDMQGIDDEKDFYTTLANTIVEKLALHTNTGVENFSRFKLFLKEVEPELGERIIVLMVDEFEELQMRVEDGRISRTIFSNIRHLMQHEEKLIFLFCGTHKIEEMAADYWSIFFNTAVYYRLSRLKPQDAIRLIKEPVKDQLTYDDLAVEQILKMTGGQPYLIQLVCRTLVNALNEKKKRNDALIDDVDDAVDAIIKGGTEHFSQHIWDDATTFERLVLSALAEGLTHTQADHMGVEGIYDKIQTVSSSFTRKQMMETLGKLVSREILLEKGLVYSFPVHLLRKWIAARYPLRKVREEI